MTETVVLLHGIWMPALVMGLLAMRLRRCGYRVVLFSYHSLTQPLERNAEQLAGFVREQVDATVHLVGHSLGGLVTLQALKLSPELIKGRIVLLGSPVKGSVVANRMHRYRGLRWMLGKNAHGSLLGGGSGWDGHLSLGIIAGTLPVGLGQISGGLTGENDGIVTVAETYLEHASSAIKMRVNHMGLLVSRQVAGNVCAFLKAGRFSSL